MLITDPALLKRLSLMPVPTGSPSEACAALIAWCRASNLLHFTLPEALGGEGAPLAHAVMVAFELARRSGSAGLTYAMHMGQLMAWAGHLGGSDYLTAQLRGLVAVRGLIASVVSEPQTGGDIHKAAARIDAGVLVKETSNTSYVPDAVAFLVTAMDDGPRPVQRMVLVRADATVAQVRHQNRLLGMTGIDNASYAFTFRYPPAAVFAEPFATIASATMTPATHLLWAGVWSGLAARALDTARAYAKAEVPPAAQPAVQARLSGLRNQHYLINALIRDNLPDARPPNPFEAAARINRLKIMASDAARDVVLACLEVTGLRGYAQTGPYSLTDAVADVLSGPIMVSNARLQGNTAGIDRYSDERP